MNLNRIVRIYIKRFRPRAKRELEWFENQPTMKAAIDQAALATNSKGKRFSHQRRLSRKTLEKARKKLSARQKRLTQAKNFEALIDEVETAVRPIWGIGDLYVYDTAVRLGAKLHLLPSKVYLHAGTRAGARALGFDGKPKTLSKSALPRAVRELEPREIEDVLCIFKDDFNKPAVGKITCGSKSSWCD